MKASSSEPGRSRVEKAPRLRGGRAGASSAILVLHGGREHGHEATHPGQLAHLRMLDLYLGLRRSGPDCAVYLLQHRVRGWNAGLAEPSPVADARWALSQIRAAHQDVPIALLGHSMGGRTAMAVAATPGVVGVCALAPWLPTDEPLPPQDGSRRIVIAHGSADRTTSPGESEAFARRLRDRGDSVTFVVQPGGRHALLDGFWDWHRFAVRSTLAMVDAAPWPIALRAALDDGSHPLDLREIARENRN